MTSFTLTHCLFDPFAMSAARCFSSCYPPQASAHECECMAMYVSVFCKLAKLFPHLLWLASKLCNLDALIPPPPQPLLTLPLAPTTLALTDRALCVILTCFLSTGAPNSTSGPPWMTNASTVGPQTAHCLSYAVIFSESLGLSVTVRV